MNLAIAESLLSISSGLITYALVAGAGDISGERHSGWNLEHHPYATLLAVGIGTGAMALQKLFSRLGG